MHCRKDHECSLGTPCWRYRSAAGSFTVVTGHQGLPTRRFSNERWTDVRQLRNTDPTEWMDTRPGPRIMSAAFPPGWYQDPTGQGQARYWNGTSWTQSTNVNGETVNIVIDPAQAEVPPVPGTQVSLPAAPTQTVASSGGSSSGSSPPSRTSDTMSPATGINGSTRRVGLRRVYI